MTNHQRGLPAQARRSFHDTRRTHGNPRWVGLLVILLASAPDIMLGAELTWTPRATSWPGPITGLCYASNHFVAVGSMVALGSFPNNVFKGVALTSETGERWQTYGVPQDLMLASV